MVVELGVIGIAVLILAAIFGVFLLLKSIKHFAVNAIVGLVILFLANAIAGLSIGYSWLVILICAIGGVLGAFLVIALHMIGIAF
jgi:hypothetical protein